MGFKRPARRHLDCVGQFDRVGQRVYRRRQYGLGQLYCLGQFNCMGQFDGVGIRITGYRRAVDCREQARRGKV
jgi:hypothetical protein